MTHPPAGPSTPPPPSGPRADAWLERILDDPLTPAGAEGGLFRPVEPRLVPGAPVRGGVRRKAAGGGASLAPGASFSLPRPPEWVWEPPYPSPPAPPNPDSPPVPKGWVRQLGRGPLYDALPSP